PALPPHQGASASGSSDDGPLSGTASACSPLRVLSLSLLLSLCGFPLSLLSQTAPLYRPLLLFYPRDHLAIVASGNGFRMRPESSAMPGNDFSAIRAAPRGEN